MEFYGVLAFSTFVAIYRSWGDCTDTSEPSRDFCRYLSCFSSRREMSVDIHVVFCVHPRHVFSQTPRLAHFFCAKRGASRSLGTAFVAIYGVHAPLGQILLLFTVFALPWDRIRCYLRCSRSLGTDFAAIRGVRAPLGQLLLLFTVFALPWDRFCFYLWCSRSLGIAFVDIYDISDLCICGRHPNVTGYIGTGGRHPNVTGHIGTGGSASQCNRLHCDRRKASQCNRLHWDRRKNIPM